MFPLKIRSRGTHEKGGQAAGEEIDANSKSEWKNAAHPAVYPYAHAPGEASYFVLAAFSTLFYIEMR